MVSFKTTYTFATLASAVILLMGCTNIASALEKPAPSVKAPASRSDVRRDVEGYASSACLTNISAADFSAQDVAFLKQQGEFWGSIIVERSKGDIEHLIGLIPVIQSAMSEMPMTMVKRDGPEDQAAQPASIFYCSEIIDNPKVRISIEKTIKKLTPFYKK